MKANNSKHKEAYSDSLNQKSDVHSPSYYNETVKSIPHLAQVRLLTAQTHGQYLQTHLNRKEHINEVVNVAEDKTLCRRTVLLTRLVHTHSYTVDNDYKHAELLEP